MLVSLPPGLVLLLPGLVLLLPGVGAGTAVVKVEVVAKAARATKMVEKRILGLDDVVAGVEVERIVGALD